MNVSRMLLKPVAFLAGLHASKQTREFLAAHRRTQAVQADLLRRLLAEHAETEFGRRHGLAGVRTYDDFVRAVPIASYEAFRPYIDRVLAGHTTALLPPGREVMMFSQTSGTTGQPKFIPVTGDFLAAMRRGWNVFGLLALQDHVEAWLRPILQISSPMRETTSPTGLPCGAISGLLARTQKRIVRRMYCVPQEAYAIDEPQAKYYAIIRCGAMHDVSFITTANPSSTIKLIQTAQAHAERLIRDIAEGTFSPPGAVSDAASRAVRYRPNPALARRMREGIARDGRLLPGHFWNVAFLANWTGGTLRLYLRRLRELFGDIPVRDIGLLASEGRFSIPLSDHTPAGVAEILDNFLEFIPAEHRDQPNPPALRAHELEVGREYFLVFSNWTGLFRYNLDDRVRVVEWFARSPVFEFLCRGRHTASITGEKVTEHQVVEAMRRACARLGCHVERFVLQGCFASTPYYRLRVEVDGRADAVSQALDEELTGLNIEYASKRKTGRLGPIRPLTLEAGQLERAERENILARRGRSEQYKHQYLMTEVVEEEDQGIGTRE